MDYWLVRDEDRLNDYWIFCGDKPRRSTTIDGQVHWFREPQEPLPYPPFASYESRHLEALRPDLVLPPGGGPVKVDSDWMEKLNEAWKENWSLMMERAELIKQRDALLSAGGRIYTLLDEGILIRSTACDDIFNQSSIPEEQEEIRDATNELEVAIALCEEKP